MIDYTLIFLHVKKTGGTTIERHLFNHLPKNTFVSRKFINNNIRDKKISKDIKFLSNHFVYGIHNRCEGPYKYFSIVRDPIDREISFYSFSLRVPELYRVLKERNINTFDDFIRMRSTPRYSGKTHFISQISQFTSMFIDGIGINKNTYCTFVKSGSNFKNIKFTDMMFDDAMENINKDFIHMGLTERFNESLYFVNDIFNLPKNSGVDRVELKSNNRPTVNDISDTTKNLIYEHCYYDFKLYNYVKENYGVC